MAAQTSESAPKVYTYHCICAQLLLASTTILSSLSARSSDKSTILPLPSSPSSTTHYAVLHSITLDPTPTMIRCEDGFEKRYIHRCSRCDVVIGYQLDKAQYDGSNEKGRREDVIYLLPGGLQETADMVKVKGLEERVGKTVAAI